MVTDKWLSSRRHCVTIYLNCDVIKKILPQFVLAGQLAIHKISHGTKKCSRSSILNLLLSFFVLGRVSTYVE